jgi:hypothetical protein
MSEVLKEAGHEVVSSDLFDRGYGETKDFFDIKTRYPTIVTNPPFSIAEQVLKHALFLADKKVAILLRLAFLESVRRYKEIYENCPPTKVLIFTERLSMYPKGYEVKGGGTTAYGWFIWDIDEYVKDQTILEWIEPGLKNAK